MVDYSLHQFYDAKSKWTFNLKIILKDQTDLSDTVYKEFEKSFEDSTNKFKVTLISTAETLQYRITNSIHKNQFIMRVSLPSSTKPEIDQEYKLRVKSFSESLDPNIVDNTRYHTLYEKKMDFTAKVLKIYEPPLTPTMTSVAETTGTVNQRSFEVSTGTAGCFSLFSLDQDGYLLKFNQFLNLLKRIKLIGMYFGISLQSFIERLSDDKERPDPASEGREGPSNSTTRILEVSLTSNQENSIGEFSNGDKNKLDKFLISLFFEGPLMIKSFLYDISWILKIVGMFLFERMRSKNEVKPWKLNYLKWQRKVHFVLTMSCIMDVFFFGIRIILHRRNDLVSVLVKFICCLNLSLLIVDILEIITISMNLKYEEQKKEEEEEDHKSSHKTQKNQLQRLGSGTEKEIRSRKNKQKGTEKNIVHPRSSHRRQRSGTEKEALRREILSERESRQNLNLSGSFMEEHFKYEAEREKSRKNNRRKDKLPKKGKSGIQRRPKKRGAKRTKKLIINVKKTLEYNSRNMSVEEFTRAPLVNNPKVYQSSLSLLNNSFNTIHLALLQVLLAALPNSPRLLVVLLVILEATFYVFTVVPYLTNFRFLSCVEFAYKTVKLVFMGGFFFVCFLIAFNRNREESPVSRFLQDAGITFIILGIVFTYLFTIVKFIVMIVKTVKKLCQKKKKKKSKDELEYEEQRGLIFYTDHEEMEDILNGEGDGMDVRRGLDGLSGALRRKRHKKMRNNKPFSFISKKEAENLKKKNRGEKQGERKSSRRRLPGSTEKKKRNRRSELKSRFNSIKQKMEMAEAEFGEGSNESLEPAHNHEKQKKLGGKKGKFGRQPRLLKGSKSLKNRSKKSLLYF